MKYTTEVGICGDESGEHKIEDSTLYGTAPGPKGYKHPAKVEDEIGDSEGNAYHMLTQIRLCKSHYLAARQAKYPEADQPDI